LIKTSRKKLSASATSRSDLVLQSEQIEVVFRRVPFTVVRIRNRRTREIVCAGGRQTILIRTPLELFEPVLLTEVLEVREKNGGVSFSVADASGKYHASVLMTSDVDGIRFRMNATAPVPIWLVEWKLDGFQLSEVIVPALGGQSLSNRMPLETTVSYKYPFWWNAQFVLGRTKDGGCIVRTKDRGPDLKMLRVRREAEGFALTYGFEAPGPLRSKMLAAEWFIDCYSGSWKQPVDRHRAWMERAFDLQTLEMNSSYPEWMKSINFVLEMWGITKDRSEPLHTFDQMISRLHEWQKLHRPEETLVYLPGFAEHGIDSHAPDYNPSNDLGGPRGFKRLLKEAHRMGYRVMAHTNVLALTYRHRLFSKLRKHQVVDVFGRPQGWGLDMDGDWLAEPYFAYVNPGAEAWTRVMKQVIGTLIREYGVDAVFLDQTLLAFNVSRGPNFVQGMRKHVRRLQEAFPDTLFAGEGLHEQVVNALPVAQIHGIDSIAEVHGMDGIQQWKTAHPVSTYLFGPYTRFVAHLLTKHPSHPMFHLQEQAYAELGVIPALCLYHHKQSMTLPAVRSMVRRAKNMR
jgi:hypothetical protein